MIARCPICGCCAMDDDQLRLDKYIAAMDAERRLAALAEAVREYTRLMDRFDVESFGVADITPGLKASVIAARAAVDALVGGENAN